MKISDCWSAVWWFLSVTVPLRVSNYQYCFWWVVVLILSLLFSSVQGGRKTFWHRGCGLSRALRPQLIAQRAPSVISYTQH